MGLWGALAGSMSRTWTRARAMVKSTKGERMFMSVLPTYAGIPATWAQNRAELANHLRGWSYVAINALCEEIAGMHPLLARVCDGVELQKARAKALGIADQHQRRARLAELSAQYLPRAQRAKALAHLQPHEELEPIGRNHPMLRLLRKPNPYDTYWTFQYRVVMFLRSQGVAYIWVVNNNAGEPCQLWSLPSHWVRKVPSPTEIVGHWEIRPAMGYVASDWGFGWYPGGSGVLELPPGALIEIAYPNPVNPFDGYAPAVACSDWVDTAENIDRCRTAHFQNGWFPGVAVEIDKDIVDPDPNLIARFQADIANRYLGVLKTNKPVVLAPGMKLVPLNTNPEDMDYVAGADQMKTFNLAVHKTGPSVVGMAEATTFASMIAATANFYRTAVKPQLTLLGEIYTEYLCPRFGAEAEDLVCYWPDPTMDDPEMLLRKWVAAMEKAAATPNEFRDKVLNMEAFPEGGDDPMAPAGLSPIPFNTGNDYADVLLPALAGQQAEEREQQAEQLDQEQAGQGQETGAGAGGRLALGEGQTEHEDRMAALRNGTGKLNGRR